MEITTKLVLDKILESPNLVPELAAAEVEALGLQVVEDYRRDLDSRQEWMQRNEKAVKLALQVREAKSFPWENCSNVKFPLLTIAALQFLARVSVLTKGRKLARVESLGRDATGRQAARAERISNHLSLQLTEEATGWVDHDEQAKFAASILGSAFKKTYPDPVRGVTVSEHVPAMDFVVDYYCKDLATASRATHRLDMTANMLQERVRRGVFVPLKGGTEAPGLAMAGNLLQEAADEAEGTRPAADDHSKPYEVLEQHLWLDLDGDGYEEPYVVSVRSDTAQVLRVVARFLGEGDVYRVNDMAVRALEEQVRKLQAEADEAQGQAREAGEFPEAPAAGGGAMAEISRLERAIDKLDSASDNHIIRIEPTQYFTRYLFIPSPDGGFYGLGLGALLGPMNESVNTLVNQLIDSGTMGNTAGGFLGKGVKLKGGRMAFDPFEWKPVDSTGDDLRKNIFPLPVRDPSPVLFQLLGMLVEYSERIGGATDIMTGVSPGQNTPAETSRNTVEQGMMLFSGIYNRMYRAFKDELRKFYTFNRLYLTSSPQYDLLTRGPDAVIAPDDYTSGSYRIYPAAAPEAVSLTQRKEKAGVLLKLAMEVPGFDKYKVVRRFLEAHDFEGIEDIYPDPTGPRAIPVPPNPKTELEKARLAAEQEQHHNEMQLATIQMKLDTDLNAAKIAELQAKATKYLADAEGVDTGHQIAMIEAEIGARKAHQESLVKALGLMHKAVETQMRGKAVAGGGKPGAAGAGGEPAVDQPPGAAPAMPGTI
jgi:chaperonin GroES